jgi:hypothetical protein
MKKIAAIEAIIIAILIIIIFAIWDDSEQYTKNNTYAINEYEYLDVHDYRFLQMYINTTPNYYYTSDFLWKQTTALLNNIYLNNDSGSSIELSDNDLILKKIYENHDMYDYIYNDHITSGNISVVNVIHYNNKAVVSYVYSINVTDEYGFVICHDEINYAYPNKMLMNKDDNGIWSVIDIISAV